MASVLGASLPRRVLEDWWLKLREQKLHLSPTGASELVCFYLGFPCILPPPCPFSWAPLKWKKMGRNWRFGCSPAAPTQARGGLVRARWCHAGTPRVGCCVMLLSAAFPQKWSPPRLLICSDTAVLTSAPLWGRDTAFLCLALNPARLWCVAMRHCSRFASLPALCKHIRGTSNDGLIKEQFSCNLSPGTVYSGSSSQLCQRCTCSLHHAKAAPHDNRPWPCFRISFQHHVPFLGAPKLNMRSPNLLGTMLAHGHLSL